MKTVILLTVAFGLLSAAGVAADTIYTWTDANGVQRYSDAPPDGVEDYRRIDAPALRPDSPEADDKRRSSYDRMVQQANQEARQLERERKEKES